MLSQIMPDGRILSCKAACSLFVASDASLFTLFFQQVTDRGVVLCQRTPVPVIEGIALLATTSNDEILAAAPVVVIALIEARKGKVKQ